MNITNTTKEGRLEFFSALYESARMSSAEIREALDRRMNQYKGSTEIDGSDEAAATVRNITYELIESQISSDIPMPKTDASSYSETRSRNAENVERLLRSLRDKLPFEQMNDIDERYTYIYGGSIWYAEWDNSEEHLGEVGTVRVHCISPRDFIPQPGIYNITDMEYCFLRFTTTRGEVMRKYGVKDEDIDKLDCEYEYRTGSEEGDTVAVIICFYRDPDGEVGRFIYSGEVTLSDLPRYYMRKGEICPICGSDSGCACGAKRRIGEITRERIMRDIILPSGDTIPAFAFAEGADGAVIPKRTTIPYYTPKRFPIVIRKNTSGENTLFGQSDCDYIRPEQQAINKVESRILKKLLRAAVTPIVPEDATVTTNNSVFGQVIKLKPGESVAQYGKVDTTPDISQDIAEAERLYDHAKRVIGISDAYQGIDQAAHESGVARQLRISQASGRLESKRKMKHTAYAELDRIIFTLYLAFADEPRRLSYKDAYGRVHSQEFNRYDFLEYDPKLNEYFYDDDYLFSVDLNGGSEYQREALWQRNLENLKAGTLGNPENPITLLRYWQSQERAHYPHARENVEYFLAEVEQAKRGGVAYGEDGYELQRLR
ncbi:MAG: hypothetical protein IKC87_03060 [Clostridia bacterium]|nr:hypothetical protein [Clostridia bacterium]